MKIIDKLVIRYRLWKVVKKWNKDLSWIRDQIEKPYGSKESIVSQLKWEHLIFQEIKMRILLGIQVARKDFDFIPFNIETANNASGCMSKLELCVKSFLAFEKVST